MFSISVGELIALLIILPLAGGVIGYVMGSDPKKNNKESEALKAAQAELERYRGQVTAHMQESAELFGDMTQQYRRIYKHLAQSAVDLCDAEDGTVSQLDELKRVALAFQQSTAGQSADEAEELQAAAAQEQEVDEAEMPTQSDTADEADNNKAAETAKSA